MSRGSAARTPPTRAEVAANMVRMRAAIMTDVRERIKAVLDGYHEVYVRPLEERVAWLELPWWRRLFRRRPRAKSVSERWTEARERLLVEQAEPEPEPPPASCPHCGARGVTYREGIELPVGAALPDGWSRCPQALGLHVPESPPEPAPGPEPGQQPTTQPEPEAGP